VQKIESKRPEGGDLVNEEDIYEGMSVRVE
jgi:hypothetical protein